MGRNLFFVENMLHEHLSNIYSDKHDSGSYLHLFMKLKFKTFVLINDTLILFVILISITSKLNNLHFSMKIHDI